ncbi:hypothetical protein PM082_004371 [Marasmius tenuissimus]|nr:hypothetical protein PM082_004371 [Marasmius tenuissimus]
MTDPQPYNLTIPSQTATLLYNPPRARDSSKASDGWELAYSSYWKDRGIHREGLGADFHNSTKAGASITFNWLGTAIYVYGIGTKESYNLFVDGQNVSKTFDVQQGGLLGSMTGMQYKEHEAILQVVGGAMLAFQYADITIGLGYPGGKIQNQTIQAVLEEGGTHKPNPFFDFKNDSSGWAPESDLAAITFPNGTSSLITRQMLTDGLNDSLRFNVTSASAFILWGSLYSDHYVKRIAISPRPGPNNLTGTKETLMYDTGRYGDFQQILHWESGLDRETSYLVEVSAFKGQQRIAFNELQLLNGCEEPQLGISDLSLAELTYAFFLLSEACCHHSWMKGIVII